MCGRNSPRADQDGSTLGHRKEAHTTGDTDLQCTPARACKYLGVWLNQSGTYKDYAAERARKGTAALNIMTGLLRNTGDPRQARSILGAAVLPGLLHGCEIWAAKMGKTHWALLERVARRIALRICCGYRTISKDVAHVTSLFFAELQFGNSSGGSSQLSINLLFNVRS